MANLHRETFELRQQTMDHLRNTLTTVAAQGSSSLSIWEAGVLPLAAGQVQLPEQWDGAELTLYNLGALTDQPTFHLEFRQDVSRVDGPACTVTPRYGMLSDGTTVWAMNGREYANVREVVANTTFTREHAEAARERLETGNMLKNLVHRLLRPETFPQKIGRLLGQSAVYIHPLGNWPQ